MDTPIVNRVAQSGLITIDPSTFKPEAGTVLSFDIADHLFQGMMLKEKEFRASLKALDWSIYTNKVVAVFCSTDAIVPQWAPMLIASYLSNVDARVSFSSSTELENQMLLEAIMAIDPKQYADKRVVIKGCGDKVPQAAYVALMQKLQPIVLSIMYGEPCSTVPIYKKKKNLT